MVEMAVATVLVLGPWIIVAGVESGPSLPSADRLVPPNDWLSTPAKHQPESTESFFVSAEAVGLQLLLAMVP